MKITSKLRSLTFPVLFILLLLNVFTVVPSAFASDSFTGGFHPLSNDDCETAGLGCESNDDVYTLATVIGNILNTSLILVSIAAIIVIIIGGVYYIMSMGDSQKTAKAKNTILYAVIGLIVAALALVIILFVVNTIDSSGGGSSGASASTSASASSSK